MILEAFGRDESTSIHLLMFPRTSLTNNNLIVRPEVMTSTYGIGTVQLNYASNIREVTYLLIFNAQKSNTCLLHYSTWCNVVPSHMLRLT